LREHEFEMSTKIVATRTGEFLPASASRFVPHTAGDLARLFAHKRSAVESPLAELSQLALLQPVVFHPEAKPAAPSAGQPTSTQRKPGTFRPQPASSTRTREKRLARVARKLARSPRGRTPGA